VAGDWIKMRLDLASDPAVVRIRRATGLDADSVVGKLHRLWGWADVHTADGSAAGLDVDWVDETAGVPGFGAAMIAAGWLEADGIGIRFTNFDKHNGQPAKVRALSKNRMKRVRCADSATDASPEKRREEKSNTPAAPVATSEPPKRRKRSQHPAAVSWDSEAGWQGITDSDRLEWRAAYPGAVLDQELAKATAWLKANPGRAGKRNWKAFVVRWLGKCQDGGGTSRTVGRRPDEKPPPKVWRDQYQPAPYRTPKEIAGLATTLKLKEEDL